MMKTVMRISFATALAGLLVFAGCKKYEEGPALSLRSKKARVAGTWTIEKVTQKGTDVTNAYTASNPKWEMTKDGKYTFTATVFGAPVTDNGTWEFINDKEEIKMLSGMTGATPDTIVILKLKNKELWYKPKTDPDQEEVHLKGE